MHEQEGANSQNFPMSTSTKPLAVVTGASSGIGFELAKQFAKNGYDLLIVSNSSAIQTAAKDLEALGAQVTAVEADLATFNGVHEAYEKISEGGRPVEAVAFNAGVGVGGRFAGPKGGPETTDLKEELNMIELNCVSTVHLAKHVLRDMAAQGRGKVLFTASIASTTPTPFEAVYGATKAFVMSFAESVRSELKDTGVTVTALQPGATETNFFHRAGMDGTKVEEQSHNNKPEDVAREGFEAMMAGKDSVVGSTTFMTKVQGALNEILPETLKAAQHRGESEPGSAEKK